MINILYIPDYHAQDEVSNERAEMAGRLIVHRQPDIIVQGGDLFDFPSLSHFDKGKLQFEGRRYLKDINAGIDAQERLFKPLDDYNRSRTKTKYKPRRCITLGNHEYRAIRAVQEKPEMEGLMSESDMHLAEFGWEVTQFKEVLEIEGIHFTHYFPNGPMDKAISGVNIGRSIIQRHHVSGFQGHNHVWNVANEKTADGRRLWAGSLGWYGDHREHYVSQTTQNTWWSGLTMISVENGIIDLETISLEKIKKVYG